MKNISKYFFIALVFIAANLYIGYHFAHQFEDFRLKNSPMSMKILRDLLPLFVSTFDIDEDKEDEVVMLGRTYPDGRKVFSIFEPIEKGYVEKNFGDILIPPDSFFLDGYFDDKKKIFAYRFLVPKEGEFFLEERNNRQYMRSHVKCESFRHKPVDQGTGIKGVALVDLESDKKKELLVTLVSYYKHKPRGVVCFDAHSGKLLWEYYCGALIRDIEIIDIDKDNKKEIVLSTNAVNNGAEMNGTSDAFSYVIVLDSRGKELWKKQTGDWYTSALSTVTDLDDDGDFEIVCGLECHRPRTDVDGKIMVLDGLTGDMEALYPFKDVSCSRPLILNAGEEDVRIYAADSSGRIWMFDRYLHELKNIREDSPMGIWGAAVKPGNRNFIYAVSRDKLTIYNTSLDKKIFSHDFNRPFNADLVDASVHIIPLRTTAGHHALIKTDRLYLLSDSGISFLKILGNLVYSGLLFSILLSILFNGLFFYAIHRFRRSNTGYNRQKNEEESLQFFEIVQGIAHQIKNPISTILWAAEKIKRSISGIKDRKIRESFDQLSGFLLDDVKSLKQQSNNILRVIRIQQPLFRETNIKPMLQKIAAHYRAVVDKNIKVQLEVKEEVTLAVDEDLIKEALVNLIDNAVAAMTGGGTLTIAALPIASPLKGDIKEILIEIEDTGSGMAEEDVSRVFDPFFTKKEKGTGLGLTICKRIIQAHGGTIEIHSREDFGTRIAIHIPARS